MTDWALTKLFLFGMENGKLLKPYPNIDVWYPDEAWIPVYRKDEFRYTHGISTIFG